MRILLTGATGFVGKHLARKLVLQGHQLTILSRRPETVADRLGIPCQSFAWEPVQGLPPKEAFRGIEGVINLMGESLADGRWTNDRKKKIYESRVLGTKHLAEGIERYLDKPLDFMISFSAIGFYPSNLDRDLDETSAAGEGFLPEVCRDWEEAAKQVQKTKRLTILRVGAVLGEDGGAMQKLLPLFKWGVGGPIGRGNQWMSWIHIDDLVNLVSESIQNPRYEGIINAVAPEPVSNKEFTLTLGQTLRKPTILPAPTLALKLVFGEMSKVILDSQRVRSTRLKDLGFSYRYPDPVSALKEICGWVPVGLRGEEVLCERLITYQYIDRPVAEVFAFFCDPYNLERITPPLLNFQITNIEGSGVSEGTLIDYRLKLHGVPLKWKTLIKEWIPDREFVDFQLKGPYRIWHHRHSFFAVGSGTLMIDRVDYRLPLGFLGNRFGLPFVKADVQKIFKYRYDVIPSLLGRDDDSDIESPEKKVSGGFQSHTIRK